MRPWLFKSTRNQHQILKNQSILVCTTNKINQDDVSCPISGLLTIVS